MPLVVFLLLTLLPGMAFIYLWQGDTLTLALMQVSFGILMGFVYRATVRSAAKNTKPPITINRQVYLPLQVNLIVYLLIGQPLVWLFADNLIVLSVAYCLQLATFAFTCYSGLLYISRS